MASVFCGTGQKSGIAAVVVKSFGAAFKACFVI